MAAFMADVNGNFLVICESFIYPVLSGPIHVDYFWRPTNIGKSRKSIDFSWNERWIWRPILSARVGSQSLGQEWFSTQWFVSILVREQSAETCENRFEWTENNLQCFSRNVQIITQCSHHLRWALNKKSPRDRIVVTDQFWRTSAHIDLNTRLDVLICIKQ